MKLIEDLGMQPVGNGSRRRPCGLYECPACNEHFKVIHHSVESGNTTKCKSCAGRVAFTTHGKGYTKLYEKWCGMRSRCNNPNRPDYHRYGGRGISVCDEWSDFSVFEKWAVENGFEPELSIERKNNNGNYCPENCEWIPLSDLVYNKRLQSNNKSGYSGIYTREDTGKTMAQVRYKGQTVFSKQFDTERDAVIARDKFIITEGYPHKLSPLFSEWINSQEAP